MDDFWKEYLLCCVVLTVGVFFVYTIKSNQYTFDWNVLAQIVPLSWIGLLGFAGVFGLIIGGDN